MPALTPDQQALFDQIKANRAALPALMTARNHAGGNAGFSYHDSRPPHEQQPEELQAASGNSRETQLKRLIWDELGTEGGLDGINSYDSEVFTWGKGFSSGDLRTVMHTMFAEDPEAQALLLRAGIALEGNTWMVVDNDTGRVETGPNALRLLQFDNKLLSCFITLGSDPKHAVHAANAQWKYMKEKTGNVPKYAYSWPDDSIRLMAHFSHWMEHYGWGYVDYSGTGGDQYQIIRQFAGIIAKNRPDVVNHTKSGARILMGYNLADKPDHRLYAFARGSGIKSLRAGAQLLTLSADDLKSDTSLAGKLMLPNAVKGTYFDLGNV
jgi:hypothetical protein